MIGLIPCAGRAERLHGLPKFLLPLPGGFLLRDLLHTFEAGDLDVIIISNEDNGDLLNRYINEQRWNTVHVASMVVQTQTMVQTLLNQSFLAKKTQNVLMAMPDTYWTPEPDLFPQMAQMLDVSDVVLAVWRIRDSQRGKLGMVDLDGVDVRGIEDKNPFSPLEFAWGAMAWRPTFWDYMKPEHQHLGIAVNAAIADGKIVRAVIAEGNYYDCGTFEGYAELCRDLTRENERT